MLGLRKKHENSNYRVREEKWQSRYAQQSTHRHGMKANPIVTRKLKTKKESLKMLSISMKTGLDSSTRIICNLSLLQNPESPDA